MRKLVRLGLAAVLGVVLVDGTGGCLISHHETDTRSGRWVSESTFNQIEPGKTTAAWIRATLGEPTEKSQVDGQSEIWKWAYNEVKSKDGYVFLIFAGSTKTETPGAAFVELKDGLVVRKWRS